jgi:hypothetical protein
VVEVRPDQGATSDFIGGIELEKLLPPPFRSKTLDPAQTQALSMGLNPIRVRLLGKQLTRGIGLIDVDVQASARPQLDELPFDGD